MKPVNKQESHQRHRLAVPHDTWTNHDQAVRIARRRWKKNTHRLIRRVGKETTSHEVQT